MWSVFFIFENGKRDTKSSAHVLCAASLTPRSAFLKISLYIINLQVNLSFTVNLSKYLIYLIKRNLFVLLIKFITGFVRSTY